MIQRLIALVQTARTRPPGPLSAVLGAAIAAGGIALISRYQNHLVGQLQETANEIGDQGEELTALRAEVDYERSLLGNLRAERAKLEQEAAAATYPPATGDEQAS